MPPIPTLATIGGTDLAPGYAGMIAEAGPQLIESRMNESATAIDFGIAVVRGAAVAAGATGTCKPQAADADIIVGISVRNAGPMIASTDGLNTIAYARYQAVPVMRIGSIFATAFENVVEGDGVIAVVAQGGKLSGTTAGAAGAGRIAVVGAKWLTTTLAGALGKIRIVAA